MPGYLNDGSTDAPKLRFYLNTDNLVDLPPFSVWPGLRGEAALERIAADGFDGVQLGGDTEGPVTRSASLPFTGVARVNRPEEAGPVLARHAERGDQCLTLHVGWGMEDDDEAQRLIEAVLTASASHGLPAFVETHRATVTQDMWRTVQLLQRFPELLLNGDYSHFYCGQEMVYGDFEAKLDFMQPVFDRTAYLHGRIAAPGFMQAPIDSPSGRPRLAVGEADFLEHFKTMWTRAMRGFKRHAGPGDVLIFSPELLTPRYYYALLSPGESGALTESSDRYAEALLYKDIAARCFLEA